MTCDTTVVSLSVSESRCCATMVMPSDHMTGARRRYPAGRARPIAAHGGVPGPSGSGVATGSRALSRNSSGICSSGADTVTSPPPG